MKNGALVLLAALCACQEAKSGELERPPGQPIRSADAAQADGDAPDAALPAPDAESCLAEGTECYRAELPCCGGTSCVQDPGSYGLARCLAPFPVGSFCLAPAQCSSGFCVDGLCQSEACLGFGQDCYGGELPCCAGTFCALDHAHYGVATCSAPLPAGSFCTAPEQCGSGTCTDGVCGP